ncbi:hypothetical protein CGQ24_11945 [Arthrobacter sp. 7749]|nr:hypothetical protein CGQ24_11945 [Arthrobacter sp. 7749]
MNAPLTLVSSPTNFQPSSEIGSSRYRYTHDDRHLDALLVNKGSDTLVVSFHGAVSRTTTALPRFERLRTINALDVSSMYFGDPGLWADPNLELSWFTGWEGFNVPYIIAEWIVEAAKKIGASKVVLSGSSGGGFAALQISALIPNSLVVAFNSQTAIREYRINGTSYGAQKKYLSTLWPSLSTQSIDDKDFASNDWTKDLDDRFSVIDRYSRETLNRVILVQNDEEFHNEDHHIPLLNVLKQHKDKKSFRSVVYSGGAMHNPPTLDVFLFALASGLEWVRSTGPIGAVVQNDERQMGWHERLAKRIWGHEEEVPWEFEDKNYLDNFCRLKGYSKPKLLATISNLDELSEHLNQTKLVIKPSNLSSSIGVMILEKQGEIYYDYNSREKYTVEEIIEKQRKIAAKWEVASYVIEERVYDTGKYSIPRDFKFYTFSGRIALIQCIDRNESPVKVSWFDGEFEPVDSGLIANNPKFSTMTSFAKPTGWKELTKMAEGVSAEIGTPFARIDLFTTPRGAMLGEVTLTPGGPYFREHFTFAPELDRELGNLWSQGILNV